jgi:MoaA/NifB/PqqE/SkfB family radical SAM enzyme
MHQGVTLLWALRSPCNLGCRYCYFGTQETLSVQPRIPAQTGTLTHNGHTDAKLHDILAFLSTFTSDVVSRVFVAGGEPLLWSGTQQVLTALKRQECEVIVCTNGLPLRKAAVVQALLALGVDAVSISLDSYDATYNDVWRPDKSGAGWSGVVEGIETLVRLRNEQQATTKIGIYSVITQKNVDHISRTGHFVARLGVDYFVVQPISLAPDHPLHDELCLDSRHRAAFVEQLRQLQQAHLGLHLAHPTYLRQVMTTLMPSGPLPMIKSCFGGRDLFFIEPDGSVWDCPSQSKIQHTPHDQYRSIKSESAASLFSRERRCRNTDCALFSQDCVNMWQLMQFDALLQQGRSPSL